MNENNLIKRRMPIVLFTLAFIVILCVGSTVAWYYQMRENDVQKINMSSNGLPFEIATQGEDIRHQSILTSNAESGYYDVGTSENLLGEDGTTGTYYVHYENDCLMIHYHPNEDDLTTEDIDESLPPDIGPGGFGQMSLYIIPKESGQLNARFTLRVVGYATVGNEVKRVSDLTPGNGLTQADINHMKQAEDYLNGHIMFFGEESESPTQYYYVNPYTERSFPFVKANAVAGTAYPVPIHWMWINTFGQIALKDNSSGLRGSLVPIVQDSSAAGSDKLKVIQYLKDNKSIIFQNLEKIAGLSEEAKAGKTEEEIQELISNAVDDKIDNAHVRANYNALSDGYNLADFMIGTSLSYFVIEVRVEASE